MPTFETLPTELIPHANRCFLAGRSSVISTLDPCLAKSEPVPDMIDQLEHVINKKQPTIISHQGHNIMQTVYSYQAFPARLPPGCKVVLQSYRQNLNTTKYM